MQFSDNLFSMTGRVKMYRPDASAIQIQGWVNDRIRQALDSRTYWSDLLARQVLNIPAVYNTGTATTTTGSALVNGTTTAWPVNDLVNTTIALGVSEIGYVEVTPAAMASITADSLLYVDTGASAETVAVVNTTATTFIARFTNTHAPNVTVTASSLAGRQFRFSGSTPVWTVISVQTATQLTLDNPWAGAPQTSQAYEIVKAYYTLATDMKDILTMVDPQYGLPLRIHVPVMEINWRDPQRSSSGNPQCLVDLTPSLSGNMQYELWPWQKSARGLPYLYHRQWPEMTADTDKPPSFINPTIFIHGAIADALNWKKGGGDLYHNPQVANTYEQRFLMGMEDAKNADESKFQRAYTFNFESLFGAGGANFWTSHDPDVVHWSL